MSAAARTAVDSVRAARAPRTFPLALGSCGRPEMLTSAEHQALLELGLKGLRRNRSRGVPRRTAAQWKSLAGMVGPLDAARADLHHGDHIRFQRAGAHAAAIVLQRCADTGRSY